MNNKRFISASVVLRSVQAGGNLNNGSNAGLAARNANNSLANTNTNNGSQLSCIYLSTDINLASWQNIKTLSNGISSSNAKIPNDTADMKRIGNIYDEFCSIENIKRAFHIYLEKQFERSLNWYLNTVCTGAVFFVQFVT
jgi:hypothetical protein